MTATPTAAVVLALFAQVALIQFAVEDQQVEQMYGVHPHHLLVCDALELDSSGQTWPRHTGHQWGLKTAGLARDVDEMFCRSSTSRDGLLP
jgi:hypothetical protein